MYGAVELAGIRPTFGTLSLADAAELLQGLHRVNVRQFASGEVPSVLARLTPHRLGYRRVRYVRRDPGEHWKMARELVLDGEGDCEDLAAAVSGELEARGIPARPVIRSVRPGLAHSLVELEDGRILDPSRLAGMGESREGAIR